MNRGRMTKNTSTNGLHKTIINYILETPKIFLQLLEVIIYRIVWELVYPHEITDK